MRLYEAPHNPTGAIVPATPGERPEGRLSFSEKRRRKQSRKLSRQIGRLGRGRFKAGTIYRGAFDAIYAENLYRSIDSRDEGRELRRLLGKTWRIDPAQFAMMARQAGISGPIDGSPEQRRLVAVWLILSLSRRDDRQ